MLKITELFSEAHSNVNCLLRACSVAVHLLNKNVAGIRRMSWCYIVQGS